MSPLAKAKFWNLVSLAALARLRQEALEKQARLAHEEVMKGARKAGERAEQLMWDAQALLHENKCGRDHIDEADTVKSLVGVMRNIGIPPDNRDLAAARDLFESEEDQESST